MRPLALGLLLVTATTLSACSCLYPTRRVTSTHDWEAWVDHRRPGEMSLHVRGEMSAAHAGWSANVHRIEGVHPRQLVLAVDMEETEGHFPKGKNPVQVSWDQFQYDGGHDTVMVVPGDGSGIVIDIEQLQPMRRHVPAARSGPAEVVSTMEKGR